MKKSVKNTKMSDVFTLNNIVGLILAILIIFELNVENTFKETLKSPPGMILSLVILIFIFVFMHPIVGLLFLIYLYECVKDTGLNPTKYLNTQYMKDSVMNTLNHTMKNEQLKKDKVELEVVHNMAPIVKKSENPKSVFVPHIKNNISFDVINN